MSGADFMRFIATLLLLTASTQAWAEIPDCSGPNGWPAGMAFTHMKNADILTNDLVDFTKTTSKKLSYEKIGKDLYRQVHLVTFELKDGKLVQAIVWSDASSEECSMGKVQVFVICQTLGEAPKAPY
jgi:hypothetical protein